MANLLATKPLEMILDESAEGGEHSLKRVLGATNLITLGIGAIIGAGIPAVSATVQKPVLPGLSPRGTDV